LTQLLFLADRDIVLFIAVTAPSVQTTVFADSCEINAQC